MKYFKIVLLSAAALSLFFAVSLFAQGAPNETVLADVGLDKGQVASFDNALCARLIRQGKVYLERGRHLEAKKLFAKAVMVDPTSQVAWRNYDIAVIYLMAEKVEAAPGLVGVPGAPSTPGDGGAAPAAPAQQEEGC